MVFFVGDMVDNSVYNEKECNYLSPLSKIANLYPTFAIHGNHEYGIGGGKAIADPNYRVANMSNETKICVKNLGIKYLVNKLKEITIKDQKLYIFGGDSLWSDNLDYSVLKTIEDKNIDTIALLHNPASLFEASKYDIDLVLSGHTHGGQIRLPFLGQIGKVDNILPNCWYQGWIKYKNTDMFVTSGIGESGTRARLFNPPEIVVLEIE